MANCVRNIHTKNYQNRTICFQVTVKNVGIFLRHSVKRLYMQGGLHHINVKANAP